MTLCNIRCSIKSSETVSSWTSWTSVFVMEGAGLFSPYNECLNDIELSNDDSFDNISIRGISKLFKRSVK